MRLPKFWGVRNEDEELGDILLSRAIKTPPNPTIMSMRTQLLDFLYALDTQNTISSSTCHADRIFTDLKDQYYDLSSSRWNHLEIPRQFIFDGDINNFVKECRHRILVGDPLAREAPSIEEGQSFQRGGLYGAVSKAGLLENTQQAPVVHLASGRRAASRRSDSFWVQKAF